MYTRHTAVPLSARTIRVRRYPSYSSSKKVFSRLHVLAKLSQFKELVKHAVVDRNKRKELER